MIEVEYMQLLQYRAAQELPTLRLFRRNIVRLKIEDRTVRAGIKGQCDLYGYWRNGRVIEIEMKGLKTPMTKEQETWRDWCRSWGIPWTCLRPFNGEVDPVGRWVIELENFNRP